REGAGEIADRQRGRQREPLAPQRDAEFVSTLPGRAGEGQRRLAVSLREQLGELGLAVERDREKRGMRPRPLDRSLPVASHPPPSAWLGGRGQGCGAPEPMPKAGIAIRKVPPMLRLPSAFLALLAAAGCAAVAGDPEIAPGQLSEATLKEVTRTLSLDEFEGRAPGTPGEEKTLAYLVEQFERAGLQPGNNGSWFQDVPLVEIAASNHEPLTIAGK